MSVQVHIVSRGARTPIGLRSPTSAAAFRAGINRVRELSHLRDRAGHPMFAALDGVLPRDVFGPERLSTIAKTALHEACELLEPGRARLPVPLLLALPEPRPGLTRVELEQVAQGLRGATASVEVTEVVTIAEGHAAGFVALARAVDEIRRGRDVCLVGGVDGYYHPATLEWLDASLRLSGGDARSAFVPGEGAGFVMLMSSAAARSLGLRSLACVPAVSVGFEPKPSEGPTPCIGEGLTDTIRRVLEQLPASERTIDDIVCDINGERHRAEEWGFVGLRLGQWLGDPTAYRSPADGWGDMGAASCPLFGCLAIEAAERGYAKGSRTLTWASSDGGRRGAAVLAR